MKEMIEHIDWNFIADEMHQKGFAIIPKFLTSGKCSELIRGYENTQTYRKTVVVLKPGKGDMLIFTTNFRPVKGAKGYYRANMKHGVSEVHTGERYTLGIIFHDALN